MVVGGIIVVSCVRKELVWFLFFVLFIFNLKFWKGVFNGEDFGYIFLF